jgi:tripartite-type tricarboxylate transporter receptor subunit TctC
MRLTRRHTLTTGAGLLGTALLPRLSFGQDWPTRPIAVAMAAPAGGATDRGTRAFTDDMREHLGAPAIAFQLDFGHSGGVAGGQGEPVQQGAGDFGDIGAIR